MKKEKCEFLVNTSTTCFLCYEAIGTGSVNQNPSSIKNICRHLEVDLSEVIPGHGDPDAPRKLWQALGRLDVRVSLCEGCRPVEEQFSNLYRELEVIRMKLGLCLETLLERMMMVEQGKRSQLVKGYRDKLEGDPGARGHQGMVNKLRKEIEGKCRETFKKHQPRIRIQRLPNAKGRPNSGGRAATVKLERVKTEAGRGGRTQVPVEMITLTPWLNVAAINNDTKPGEHQQRHLENGNRPCRHCGRTFSNKYNRERHMRRLKGRCRLGVTQPGGRNKAGHSKTPGGKQKQKHPHLQQEDQKPVVTVGPPGPGGQDRHGGHRLHATPPNPTQPPKRGRRSKGKPFSCSHCWNSFSSKIGLTIHFQRKHLGKLKSAGVGKNAFVCDICQMSFAFKCSLQIHRESLHFGRQFPCTSCGKIFTRNSSLYKHVSWHCKVRKDRIKEMQMEGIDGTPQQSFPDSVPLLATASQPEMIFVDMNKVNVQVNEEDRSTANLKIKLEEEEDLIEHNFNQHQRPGNHHPQNGQARPVEFKLDPLDDLIVD